MLKFSISVISTCWWNWGTKLFKWLVQWRNAGWGEAFRFERRQSNLRACCVGPYAAVFSTPVYPVLDTDEASVASGYQLTGESSTPRGQRPVSCSGPFSFFIRWMLCTVTLGSLSSVWRSKIDYSWSWLWGWELFIPTFRRRSRYLCLCLWFFSESCWICQGWCTIRVLLYFCFPRLVGPDFYTRFPNSGPLPEGPAMITVNVVFLCMCMYNTYRNIALFRKVERNTRQHP